MIKTQNIKIMTSNNLKKRALQLIVFILTAVLLYLAIQYLPAIILKLIRGSE